MWWRITCIDIKLQKKRIIFKRASDIKLTFIKIYSKNFIKLGVIKYSEQVNI